MHIHYPMFKPYFVTLTTKGRAQSAVVLASSPVRIIEAYSEHVDSVDIHGCGIPGPDVLTHEDFMATLDDLPESLRIMADYCWLSKDMPRTHDGCEWQLHGPERVRFRLPRQVPRRP